MITFKMQIKFLKSIVEHLTSKQAVPIVDLLADKKDINEFLIAKKLGLTINQTRNILYKLLICLSIAFIFTYYIIIIGIFLSILLVRSLCRNNGKPYSYKMSFNNLFRTSESYRTGTLTT